MKGPEVEVDDRYSYESYDPDYGYDSGDTLLTYDAELKYAEGNGYEYFGPMSKEEEKSWDRVRDGVIDFSGFEFAIGIIFRF